MSEGDCRQKGSSEMEVTDLFPKCLPQSAIAIHLRHRSGVTFIEWLLPHTKSRIDVYPGPLLGGYCKLPCAVPLSWATDLRSKRNHDMDCFVRTWTALSTGGLTGDHTEN